MRVAGLQELINYLEYGTRLHIGAVFLGNLSHEALRVPPERRMHTSPICDAMKERPNGRRCIRCRNAAIAKAVQTREAFDGICVNGVYEYTRPLVIDGEVVCVIYVGNILPSAEKRTRLFRRLSGREALLKTLEPNFDRARCETVASLLEDYIRMAIACLPAEENADRHPLIENMKAYTQENLEGEISLAILSRLFHYNEKYLGRLFKQVEGVCFHEYVNRERLKRAERLLRGEKRSVIEIAAAVGFENVTYFNRLFKQVYRTIPSEYRRIAQKQR